MATRRKQSTDENMQAEAGATAEAPDAGGAAEVQAAMNEATEKGYRGTVRRLDGDGEGKPNRAFTVAEGGDR